MLLHRSLTDDKIQNCRLCKSQGAVLLTNSGIYKDASERGSALYGMTLKGSGVPVVVFSLAKSVSPPCQDVVTRYFCLEAIAHGDDVDKHVRTRRPTKRGTHCFANIESSIAPPHEDGFCIVSI